jgi:small subunit ribosomal protein S1
LVLTLIAVLMPLVAGILGAVGLWCLVAVAFAWDHWERVEKVFGRLLGFASFVGGRAERTALSAEMQGVINGARKEIQEEVADAMPLPARVRFVRDDADIAELKDGEVVISLRNPRRRAENTARATIAYVSAATIRPARLYVGQTVMTGIDYSLTKRILSRADTAALDYFVTEIWQPALAREPDLRDTCDQIERVDDAGVMTRILAVEFLDLGRRLWGAAPSVAIESEAREFLRFLASVIDHSSPGLDFLHAHIRVSIGLIGEREKAEVEGLAPYTQASLRAMSKGCTAIYLLAWGARIALLREVVASLENDSRIRAVDIAEHQVWRRGDCVPAVCARLDVDQTYRSRTQLAPR